MTTDEISFSLAKNVEELRQKLNQTEQSINTLEHFAQRKYSSDERSVASSNHHDETSSIPPPLTMEELMDVSSIRSSIGSTHSHGKAASSKPQQQFNRSTHSPTLEDQQESVDCSISEYTMKSNSSLTFQLLKPDHSYQSIQLTSSPRKPASRSYELIDNASQHSISLVDRPYSSNSLQNNKSRKKASFRKSKRSTSETSQSSLTETLPQKLCYPSLGVAANDTFSSQLLNDLNASNFSNGLTPNVSPRRPISARSNATSVTLTGSDRESDHLRHKLLAARTENAQLRTLVSQLREQLEHYSDMADISTSLANNNEEQLAERVIGLLDQIKANERTLRNNEEELECKDKLAADKDKTIAMMKQKLVLSQKSLNECMNEKLSAESAQQKSAHEVVMLSHKLKEAYMSMTTRLHESQDKSQKDVAKALNDRGNALRKYEALKQENETLTGKLRELQRKLRSVENESRRQDADAAAMMDQAQQRIRELVVELDEKHLNLKKSAGELNTANQKKRDLHQQCNNLKEQNRMLSERLEGCQKENEDGKTEIDNLKRSLQQLQRSQTGAANQKSLQPTSTDVNLSMPTKISPRKHHSAISELELQIATKEAHIKRLEARLANHESDASKYETMAEEMMVISEKARASGRRANELEDVVHLMENERTKYLRKVNDLEDDIHDKSTECESFEKRLKERTTLLNQCQRQVEDLNSKLSFNEAEIKQRKEEISNLRKKINQQETDEQQLKAKLSDAQAELLEKTRTLESATERSGKVEAQNRRETKKMKKLHVEQCEELGEQIELLQKECNKYKGEANMANQQVRMMNDQLVASSRRVQQLEEEVALVRKEQRSRTQTHEKALKILEEKLSASTSTIQALEGTLGQCKNELTNYIEKLHEAQSNFKHQMALKSDQVSKLETNLKLVQTSLQNECSRTMELESALEGRQKIMEETAARIEELEESQANLQTQVARQEQQHSSESAKSRMLVHEMEGKLELACRELEAKKEQYAELNGALKKVDENFRECKKELCSVEAEVEELQCEREVRVRELERAKFEWKEMKTDLDRKIEKVAELQSEHQRWSREEKKLNEKLLDLETEATQLRAQNEDARHHNNELQAYSRQRNADVRNKEMTIKQLQTALKAAQSECDQAKQTSKELEKSLEERQWQLQQRAAQLTQLDQQVRDFRGSVEKRNVELENELERTQKQLQERNIQVSHLDDQMSTMRSDVTEVRRLLAEEELHIKRLERDLMQKEGRIEELTNTVEVERKSREERHKACIETSQEVRLAREQEQKISREYQDCQRELNRYRREQQQLLVDIQDMGNTIREKDERLDRLANQLSAMTSEKINMESKYQDEFDKTHLDVARLKQRFEDENDHLASTNAQLQARLKVATGNQSEELSSAIEREREAREELMQTKDAMLDLERELLARKQVIDAGNDTIIVKDAEIARLQAKLSGMERVNIMASLPNTPVKMLVDKENNPVSVPEENYDIIDKPPWSVDDVTPTSLFTGADSEMASLAPSFVPIAASTKRPPAPTKEDSSFFRTSSPYQEHPIHSGSTDEDSLCKRVFGDTTHHSNYDYSSSDSLTQVVVGKRRKGPADRLRPERCMADLQEKLRASEQRRREVVSKLRNLKETPR